MDLFIPEPTGFVGTDNPVILKPTFGSIGRQYVRFELHEAYSSEDSLAQGKEVKRPVEICHIQNDKFCTAALRVGGKPGVSSELTAEQQRVLAPLYERFKTQKDSNETDVLVWDAVSENEKRLLAASGVYTVEQLASYSDEDLFRLGPAGQELRERGRRHMVTKQEKAPDHTAEIARLRAEHAEELERIRQKSEAESERLRRLEAAYYAREESASADSPKRGPGRPPKARDE